MQWITLVPTHRNDGAAVSREELAELFAAVWQDFGGCSVEGPIQGHWVDDKTGRHYEDESLRLTVVCDPERLADAENMVRRIGKQLGQEAMFFEVRDYGVRFLRI